MVTFVVPQPSVVSEVWQPQQCLLSGGEGCFLISACSYLERSWCRVAAVVSASGPWVRLCPSVFDGDSTAWVLLRRLCLASAPPCRFHARFAGRRSRWGVPNARPGRFVARPLVVPS